MALCRNKWRVRAVERVRQTTIAKTTRTAAVIHGYLSQGTSVGVTGLVLSPLDLLELNKKVGL